MEGSLPVTGFELVLGMGHKGWWRPLCVRRCQILAESKASGSMMLRLELWSLAPSPAMLMENAVIPLGRPVRSGRVIDGHLQ